ncbi:DegT/DnrJ/EryC1/StrS family aminotransferase [Stenotrophomonas sp. PS02300]|uniref:DegT/DnrJ/EryC1/StrS family aminotransferase n=1 Tax=Stenotrophomonas sp. PS02300 TaxID=2991426 RepID=UPI00249C7025|nr:DegT/DnrJ/EryC1/StrS family aminotransferase [Stenotrophomonas sp. PS02300]
MSWPATYGARSCLPIARTTRTCTTCCLPSLEARTRFIEALKEQGVQAVFHYIPLHSSPAGRTFGRTGSEMTVTDDISERLVRMPLWIGVEEHLPTIFAAADKALAG